MPRIKQQGSSQAAGKVTRVPCSKQRSPRSHTLHLYILWTRDHWFSGTAGLNPSREVHDLLPHECSWLKAGPCPSVTLLTVSAVGELMMLYHFSTGSSGNQDSVQSLLANESLDWSEPLAVA